MILRLNRSRADLELIQDKNNNKRLDPGEILASSRATGRTAERIQLNRLDPGVYYIRVTSDGTGSSNYKLTASVDRARRLTQAEQIWNIVNQQRQMQGVPALALNTQLNSSAQLHSDNMAVQDFFNHTDHLGRGSRDRIVAAGYSPWYSGENIAAGNSTARDTMNQWMNSPGHRANILSVNYTEIGVGYRYLSNDTGSVNYNHYWTQNFGSY
ncbi:MAG: CAP domain-containing protein [Leptolyngbya sp. DLM2.Bin15]|nr:MAG: CAP domain-containing protein [Leptolyngbya sp. DLM2.Bin15]